MQVDINTTVEINLDVNEVIDSIYELPERDIKKVRKELIGSEETPVDLYDNLYDRDKVLILKKAMKKYDLDELLNRLEITQSEAMF